MRSKKNICEVKNNSYEKSKKKEKLTDTIVVITHCKKVIEHNLGRKRIKNWNSYILVSLNFERSTDVWSLEIV